MVENSRGGGEEKEEKLFLKLWKRSGAMCCMELPFLLRFGAHGEKVGGNGIVSLFEIFVIKVYCWRFYGPKDTEIAVEFPCLNKSGFLS